MKRSMYTDHLTSFPIAEMPDSTILSMFISVSSMSPGLWVVDKFIVLEKMFYMVCVSQEELDSRPCGQYEVELDRKRGEEYVGDVGATHRFSLAS
jgi:hypothetical protein